MSWIGTAPSRIIPAYNRLYSAVMERAENFGMTQTYEISQLQKLTPKTQRAALHIQRMRDAVIALLAYSLDARKFGAYQPLLPFYEYGAARPAAILALLAELEIAEGDFYCDPVRPLANWKFVLAGYKLLNDVILYKSPELGGSVKWKIMEHFRDTRYPGSNYDREKTGASVVGYLAKGGRAYVREADVYYKREWMDDFRLTSLSPLQGSWQAQIGPGASGTYAVRYMRKAVGYWETLQTFPWDTRIVNCSNGQSAVISIPVPQELYNKVRTQQMTEGLAGEEALYFTQPEITGCRFTAANFPAPDYEYWDQ